MYFSKNELIFNNIILPMLNVDVCEFFYFDDKRVPILTKSGTLIKQVIIQ